MLLCPCCLQMCPDHSYICAASRCFQLSLNAYSLAICICTSCLQMFSGYFNVNIASRFCHEMFSHHLLTRHHAYIFSFDHLMCMVFLYLYWAIGLMSRVFVKGPEDQGSIPRWIIPKTQKMVLDATLLNTQHYKVKIKGKVEQYRDWSRTLPCTSV